MSQDNKYVTLAPLFLVLLIDTMGFGIIFPILGPLFINPVDSIFPVTTLISVRQFWYAITMTSWGLFMFLGSPFLGDLSDKLGRKYVLLISLGATAFGFFISALGVKVHSLILLIIGRSLAGFFAGSQPIAQAMIADISTNEDKVFNMSLIIVANCLGFVIGPILGGYFSEKSLVSWFNYTTPFLLAGGLAVVNGLLLLITLKETYQPKKEVTLNLARGFLIFITAFTTKRIRMLTSVFFLSELAWSIFFLYTAIFLVQKYHYNSITVAHYMSFVGIVFAISLILIIRVMVRFMRLETVFVVSMFIMGLSALGFLYANEFWVWLLSVPLAAFSGISYSVMLTIFSNRVSRDEQGWIMGITSAVVAATYSLGGFASGSLAALNLLLPFFVAGLFAIGSSLLMLACYKHPFLSKRSTQSKKNAQNP